MEADSHRDEAPAGVRPTPGEGSNEAEPGGRPDSIQAAPAGTKANGPRAETGGPGAETEEGIGEASTSPREPLVGQIVGLVSGAIGSVIAAADDVISAADEALIGPGRSQRRHLRQLAREPLANLYEVHPEARQASPRELGLRFVPTEEIRGTAVAGAAQRGGDFLPLKPFRGTNWEARWQRIWRANERLESLPPVDLVKYAGDYWVLDGHNRVAATLYSNGMGLDAMVTELVPLDGQASERPTSLAGYLADAHALRSAAQGRKPAMGFQTTPQSSDDLLPGETSDDRPAASGPAGVGTDTEPVVGPGSGGPAGAPDDGELPGRAEDAP